MMPFVSSWVAVPPLTKRQRWAWRAHCFKAIAYQHHRPFATRILALLPKDGIVIDVGAHAGQFAKLFAKLVPQGHVYAFEPGSYALSILTRMVSLRRANNITVIPFGLSDKASTEILQMPVKKTGSFGFGLSHIGNAATVSQAPMHNEEVRLTTLDAFVAREKLTRLDFVKADIEGWELHMLQGGRASLAKFRPVLYLEISERHLARASAVPAQIFTELEGLSYAIFQLDEAKDYSCKAVAGFEGSGDYLFVPAEKANQVGLSA